MEMVDRERVRRLHRLFRLYERAGERFGRGEIAPPEMARLTAVLRQLSFDFWRGFFGPTVDAPAHQRYVLTWCQKNLEVFRRLGLIGDLEIATVTDWIARALARIEGDDPRYRWNEDGPAGPEGDALRRLYLIQNLNIRLETCARTGALASQVQEHVRKDLARRARALFDTALGGEPEDAASERAAIHAMLEEYLKRGLLTPAALAALDAEAPPPPPAALEPIPVAVLVELLRRTGAGIPTALVDELARHAPGAAPAPEALAAAAARLGLPAPAVEPEPDVLVIEAIPGPDPAPPEEPVQLGDVQVVVDESWAEEVGREMVDAGVKAAPPPSPPRATPSRPRPPRAAVPPAPTFWESVLAAMLEELGVNWLLFSGVILVVAAGVLLAVKHWADIRPFQQYLIILGGTVGFFALAMVTRVAMKLERTPAALFAVVLPFVPLNMVAIDVLDLLKPGDQGPPLALAAAVAGLAVVAVMVLWGGRTIAGAGPGVFAPALLGASGMYLVVALCERELVGLWPRIGVIVTTALIARWCLPYGTRELQRSGLLPVVLSALSLAVSATAVRTALAAGRLDLFTVGLALAAVAQVWLEAGVRLATLARGPLDEPAGTLPRILSTIGQLAVLAGACFALLPQPRHNVPGLLVLAYASRALYATFFTHRTGWSFLTFLVTPGPLLFLLPDASPTLSELWRTPLVDLVRRSGHDPALVSFLPLVLIGPFLAHLAARLARREVEGPRTLLHVAGAACAVITLAITFLPAWLGAVASALTVLFWGGLASLHRSPAERHLAGVAALGGAALTVEGLRLLALPEWFWILTAVAFAFLLLGLHVRGRSVAAPANALGDFLLPASLTVAGLALAAYARALLMGSVLAPGGAGYDASLVALAAYFAVSVRVDYNPARGLIPVPLLLIEVWVVLLRFDVVTGHNAGYLFAASAVVPWLVSRALEGELVDLHWGLAQAIAMLAFFAPPYLHGLGAGKFLALAVVHYLLIERLPVNALFAFVCAMVGVHVPLLDYLDNAPACVALQAVDLVVGLALLSRARRVEGAILLVASTAIYLCGPFLSRDSSVPVSLLASVLQAAMGAGLIALAPSLDSEMAVYAGEAALMLVYGRLFVEGWIPRTLVMGFISIGLAFTLLFTRERVFMQPRYRVYRNPAANTAVVLPVFTLLRGLDFGGPVGALLVFLAGVFYHVASFRGGPQQCLYFALILYNVASALCPAGPEFLGACRYLVPVGITLLVYSHTPNTGLSRDQVSGWRMLGTALIVGEPLPRALLGTRDDTAFLLLIGLAILIAAAGLVLRVRLYLGAGSGLFVLAVASFVLKQIFHSTHLGLFSLLIMGVVLIFAGAVFEQARARLRALAAHLEQRFQDWE